MVKELLLETRGLTKTYGKRKVVDNLNIKIAYGDIYGFLGPNGAGKTTTIRMMLGLVSPDSGVVEINGVDLKRDFKKAISSVGAMIDPTFYTYLSGYENLLLIANLIPNINKNNIKEIFKIVGLEDRADDKVKTYSLGMKQRLGIASALLNNPKLIILDEPTNGLDPQGIVEIKELILRLACENDITFVISSHLLYEVEQICTKVGIIRDGKLLAQNKVEQLLTSYYGTYEIHTSLAEKAINLINGVDYIKSCNNTSKGIIIEMEKNNAGNLNHLLVTNNIEVEAMIPQNKTLEKIFFEIQNGRK